MGRLADVWRKLVAAVLLVAIAAVAIWYATRPDPAALLAELIAELRARGEPVTLAEMESPMPPAEDNGALDLDAAMAWWTQHQPEEDWKHRIPGLWNPNLEAPWQEHATPEQLAELDAFLVTLAPLFEHVDAAAGKREIAWPAREITSAASAFDLGSPIPSIQTLARFLDARALRGATADERVRGLRAQLAIGARFRARTLIDVLVAAVVHAEAAKDMRDALEQARIDPVAARAELDALLAEPFDARFPRVVRGERAFALELLPFWIDGSMADAMGGSRGAVERVTETIERAVQGKPPVREPDAAERIGFVRELDRYLEPGVTALGVCSEKRAATWPVNDIASMLPRIRISLLRTDGAARLARVALAAYEHRHTHDEWPSSAEDLAPLFADGVPLDPYTGEALHFEVDADHLILRATPWPWLLQGQSEDPLREWGHVWRLPPR